MENKKLIILVVLGLLAVFSMVYGIVTPSKIARDTVSTEEENLGPGYDRELSPLASNLPDADICAPNSRRARMSKYTSWGRDPFALKKKAITKKVELVLNSIVWDESAPMAIINGVIVSIGDEIEGSEVIDIKKNKVILDDGAGRNILKI